VRAASAALKSAICDLREAMPGAPSGPVRPAAATAQMFLREARTDSRTSASRERNGGAQDPSRQIGTLLLYLTGARVHRMEPRSTPKAESQMSLNPTTQSRAFSSRSLWGVQ
jgi:hypothetical protein